MPEISEQQILSIYDTVADPGRWPQVLEEIAASVNAKGCLIFEADALDNLAVTEASAWYEPEALDLYLSRFADEEFKDHEVFRSQAQQGDIADVIPDTVLYNDLEEFKARPNVKWVMNVGILHRAASLLNKDNHRRGRFSVQFPADRAGISDEERATLAQVLPHVAKALELGRPAQQLAQQNYGLLSKLDTLNVGVCVLDDMGRTVESNVEFQRQSEAYSLISQDKTGVLKFTDAKSQRAFEGLTEDARRHGKYGARPRKEAVAADGDTHLCIEVVPLNAFDEIGSARFGGFVLFSTDTSRPITCDTGLLGQLFALTATEQALVASIAEGLTNAQIAERRGRSVDTVNSQVKSILAKTNCATRTQFVRMATSFGGEFILPENKT